MNGVKVKKLKYIDNPKGDLMHVLKSSESDFIKFGEAYFTSVILGETKGWKKHHKMTLNLVVPAGSVAFYVHDSESKETEKYILGQDNYCRLTVSPGLWVAFSGIETEPNLILNIASEEHDPLESENLPLNSFPIPQ